MTVSTSSLPVRLGLRELGKIENSLNFNLVPLRVSYRHSFMMKPHSLAYRLGTKSNVEGCDGCSFRFRAQLHYVQCELRIDRSVSLQQLSSNDPKWITDTDADLVHLLEEFIPAIQTHIDRQTNRVHLHAADQTAHYDPIIPNSLVRCSLLHSTKAMSRNILIIIINMVRHSTTGTHIDRHIDCVHLCHASHIFHNVLVIMIRYSLTHEIQGTHHNATARQFHLPIYLQTQL
jgi:hypothetical protein